MRVTMILPALTEATSPFFRPIKYSLFPPLGLATLAGYLRDDDEAAPGEPAGAVESGTVDVGKYDPAARTVMAASWRVGCPTNASNGEAALRQGLATRAR
jgi:hypothetical protein